MATITQLEYIVSVSQHAHFGKAAKAKHVSQPSLSMQIQKVEDELGITIFDRNAKPIALTEAGKIFVTQAHVVLDAHQKLLEITKLNNKRLSGSLRVGIIPTLAPYLLPHFAMPFSKAYPEVKLFVDEMKTEDIIQAINESQLDAGILATPLGEERIVERVLFYDAFFLYCHPEHQFAKRSSIKQEELLRTDLWLLKDGHCLRNQVLSICHFLGAAQTSEGEPLANLAFEGGSLETLRHLIRASKGYTLVPRIFVETLSNEEKQRCVRNIVEPASREISLVYRNSNWRVRLLDALFTEISKNVPK